MFSCLFSYFRKRFFRSPAERLWQNLCDTGDSYLVLFDQEKAEDLGVRLSGSYSTEDWQEPIGLITAISEVNAKICTEHMYYRDRELLTYIKFFGFEPSFMDKKMGKKRVPVKEFQRVTALRCKGEAWADLNDRLRQFLDCRENR